MPGKVVKVRRREHLGWAARLYLPTIFVGLKITGQHFFRNLWGYITGDIKTFVVQYPEERVDYADAFRGHPVLVALESGEHRLFGIEHARRAGEGQPLLAGDLGHGAVGREAAAEDLDVTSLLDRLVPGADHLLAIREAGEVGHVLGERLARHGDAVAVQGPVFEAQLDHRGRTHPRSHQHHP